MHEDPAIEQLAVHLNERSRTASRAEKDRHRVLEARRDVPTECLGVEGPTVGGVRGDDVPAVFAHEGVVVQLAAERAGGAVALGRTTTSRR